MPLGCVLYMCLCLCVGIISTSACQRTWLAAESSGTGQVYIQTRVCLFLPVLEPDLRPVFPPFVLTETYSPHIIMFLLLSDDAHFKTNPKIPGIDLNSVRMLFATLSKPAFSGLQEQVSTNMVFRNCMCTDNISIFF